MKNLKKVLALVMAFALAFTMMAGAAFTDQADIEAGTAVNMLSALGVIKGYEDGSFKPDGTVTRAEMAKMIFTVMNGGKDNADAYASMSTTFTDINGHWAAGYIKFCQSNGIIAGKSATQFDPDNVVTGTEAAKMLLVVMGYLPDKAGLVGTGWDQKTIGLASQAGLLDDVDSPMASGLPRQYAAQIIYNTLDANRVKWSTDSESFDELLTGGEKETVGEKYLELVKVSGVLLASGKVGLEGEGSEDALILDETTLSDADSDAGKEVSFTDVDTDYSALIGQDVQVLYKDSDEVYGVYATSDNKVNITTTASELDTVSDETKIEVGGTKYSVEEDGLKIYTISADETETDISDAVVADTAAEIEEAIENINKNDLPVTVISNDNDTKVDMIIINSKTFAQITAVSSSSFSYKDVVANLKGDTTGTAVKVDLEDDEPTIYDGYAKDDYVFIGADLFNDTIVVEEASTITGTNEAFKDDSIKLDGTWYDYILADDETYTAKSGSSYTAYILGGYVYCLTGATGSSSDVDTLLVKTVGSYQTMDDGVETKVYLEDGTQVIINVKNVVVPKAGFDQEDVDIDDLEDDAATYDVFAGGDSMEDQIDPDTLYAYERDGDDYTLYKLNDLYASDDVEAVLGTDASYDDNTETIDGLEADDSAPIFLQYSGDSYKVITGADLASYSDINGNASSAYLTDGDNVIAAYINTGDGSLSTSDTLYGVVEKAYKGTATEDSDTVVYLDLLTAEGSKTLETEESSYGSLQKGAIISFSGTYEKANDDIEVLNDTAAETAQYIAIGNDYSESSGLIRPYTNLYVNDTTVASNTTAGKIDSDSVVIYADEDDWDVEEDATPAKAEELDSEDGYYANAFLIVDDGDVELLVYEVNDRMKDINENEVELNETNAAVEANAAITSSVTTITSDTELTTDDLDGTEDEPYEVIADATTATLFTVDAFADVTEDGTTVTVTVTEDGATGITGITYNGANGTFTAAGTLVDGTATFRVNVAKAGGTTQTFYVTVNVNVA
ncbi:MAG: S-layer homology domain-containing protein [Intestinibacillus sp.]